MNKDKKIKSLPLSPESEASLDRGIEDAKAGRVSSLGSFQEMPCRCGPNGPCPCYIDGTNPRTKEASTDDLMLPFCACGRRWSECDGSRKACAKRARPGAIEVQRTNEAEPSLKVTQDDYARLFEHARQLARENDKLREGSGHRPDSPLPVDDNALHIMTRDRDYWRHRALQLEACPEPASPSNEVLSLTPDVAEPCKVPEETNNLLNKAISYLNQYHGSDKFTWNEHHAEVIALVEMMRPAQAPIEEACTQEKLKKESE